MSIPGSTQSITTFFTTEPKDPLEILTIYLRSFANVWNEWSPKFRAVQVSATNDRLAQLDSPREGQKRNKLKLSAESPERFDSFFLPVFKGSTAAKLPMKVNTEINEKRNDLDGGMLIKKGKRKRPFLPNVKSLVTVLSIISVEELQTVTYDYA